MSDEFERKIGFADVYGTRAEVEWNGGDDVRVELAAGFSGTQGFATPGAARQMAAALLDAAERAEEAAKA